MTLKAKEDEKKINTLLQEKVKLVQMIEE